MKRAKFINADETLQIFFRTERGTFIQESAYLGKTYDTVNDVLAELDDDVVRIVRYDFKELKGEDVTEEVATAYCETVFEEWFEPPAFVRESLVWEELNSAEPTRTDFEEHSTYQVRNGKVVG